ncbi:helix-turn-helix domain-containing protein [Nonomuraea sp. LPB2021202275-12-8]|uniref:helix-turn-helix domain-containing protein n=1 Tax=Nonomuraea sp. LPB2021202275-12-8 TaxID=3120159 RepID=UPI00300CD6DF
MSAVNAPRQLGFGFALWTRARVGELIRREFKVKLSLLSVGRVLAKLGMSPHAAVVSGLPAGPGRGGRAEAAHLWVWRNVKHDRIARASARGVEELKALGLGALRRLQKLPARVRSFFTDPHLACISASLPIVHELMN